MLEEGKDEAFIEGFFKESEVELEKIAGEFNEKTAGGEASLLRGLGGIGEGLGRVFKGVGDTWREAGKGEGMLQGLKNTFMGVGEEANKIRPGFSASEGAGGVPASEAAHPAAEPITPAAEPTTSTPQATPQSGDPGFMGPGFWARRWNKAGKGALYGGGIGALGGLPGALGGAALGGAAGLLGRAGVAGVGAGALGGGALLGRSISGDGGDFKYGQPPWNQHQMIPGISNELAGTAGGALGALMLSKELGLPLGTVTPLLLGGFLGHKFLPGMMNSAMGGGNPLASYGYGWSRDAMPSSIR